MIATLYDLNKSDRFCTDVSCRMALKGLVILLPLLGLTWMFGLMSVNSDTIVFQYLFAIFNSLQVTRLLILLNINSYLVNIWDARFHGYLVLDKCHLKILARHKDWRPATHTSALVQNHSSVAHSLAPSENRSSLSHQSSISSSSSSWSSSSSISLSL